MSARAWAAFATVSTLWGIPYLFIKIAVDDGVPPAFLAFVRVALGAAVLIALAWRAGTLGTLRGRGRWLVVYAVFEIAVPFPLIAAGEQHVASSLAAIIIAAVPLFVALLALRFDPAERATGSRLVGPDRGPGRGRGARRASTSRGAATSCWRAGAILSPPRLRGRADGLQAHARRPRPARRDGSEPGDRGRRSWRRWRPSIRPRPCPRRRRSSRSSVLGVFCTAAAFVFFGVLIAEVGPGRGARHHLRRPGGRGDARRHRPGRAPRRGRRGRAAADPRRLVAVDRRARCRRGLAAVVTRCARAAQ